MEQTSERGLVPVQSGPNRAQRRAALKKPSANNRKGTPGRKYQIVPVMVPVTTSFGQVTVPSADTKAIQQPTAKIKEFKASLKHRSLVMAKKEQRKDEKDELKAVTQST
jgi:hypothetical protein